MSEGREIDLWGSERVEDLARVMTAGAPHEDLTVDELLTACHEQAGMVWGFRDGHGAIAAGVAHDERKRRFGVIRLLVVHPDHRGSGRGSALLTLAEHWLQERSVEWIEWMGAVPFTLSPGLEPSSPLAAFAARRGYAPRGSLDWYRVPVAFRAPAPSGVTIRRTITDEDVTAVNMFAASLVPRRSDEVARALEHGTCHGAFLDDSGEVTLVGLSCHSVTRAGWCGPVVVAPAFRRRRIGHALLGQVCRDLMIAEFRSLEVPAVDPTADDLQAFIVAAGGERIRTTSTFQRHPA